MKLVKASWILLCAALLNACGGGSGGGDSPFGGGGGGGGGTGGGTTATVADLVLAASTTLLANTGSETSTVTVTALDSSRNALADVAVTLSVDSDAVLQVSGSKTDTTGKVTGTVSIGSNRSNRAITVSATAGGVTRSAQIQVYGAKIEATLSPALLEPSAAGSVRYRAVDQAGNAMNGQAVQVTAAGLNPSAASGTTSATGEFVFNYTAPAAAGTYTITASVAGASSVDTIEVQAAGAVPPVTATISSGSVRVNPSVVAVNLPGSQLNRAEVRALFVDSQNRPIPNVRVRFDLAGDANNVGGTFTVGTAPDILYSNSDGVVTTAYVPGTRSSPTNGVTVRACYGVSDTDPNFVNCTTSATQTVTVSSEPLSVTIGTNGTIVTDTLTYTKQFNVVVVDAAGNVVPDVTLVASIDLTNYRKGFYAVGGSPQRWGKVVDVICRNEDLNRNGVLDAGEDNDANPQPAPATNAGMGVLWPRKADVSVRLLSTKTDAAGSAVLEVTYNQDHGSWVDAVITVAASGIAGTEGRASYSLAPVPIDAPSANNTSSSPAYQISPYGTAASCTNPN